MCFIIGKKNIAWFRNSDIQKTNKFGDDTFCLEHFCPSFFCQDAMDEFTRLKNLKKVRHWSSNLQKSCLDIKLIGCLALSCTLQSSNYEIKKKRCKYLRSKLSHIKRKISEYDRRPWTITRQNSQPLKCQYLFNFIVGVYIVYYLYHLWFQTSVIFKNVIWEIFD